MNVSAMFSGLHTLISIHLGGHKIRPSEGAGEPYICVCHTESILSASQECAQQRWAAQMVVLTAGERTSNKAGRCQLGFGCLKHQFLAADHKVILDGFIADSLCQSAFRTHNHVWYIIFQSNSPTPLCEFYGLCIYRTYPTLFTNCQKNGK